MVDKNYLIGISVFESFGAQRTKLLVSHFKNAKNIWNASEKDLISTGLKDSFVYKFLKHRDTFDIKNYIKKLQEYSVKAISINESDYPENLKSLTDAPPILYVRGNLIEGDSKAIAIVGSRLMTAYGGEIATKFAKELAQNRITVVSGLALGTDAAAHRSAFLSGGRTIAVLASGLDIISPLSNKNLALDFIKKNGAIVSEYPLGHVPSKFDFAVRNRLISGLSKAVIVIEARMKSGTFYTVKSALDQGRPVFAVPGQITSEASEGTNYLIQNGAGLALNIADILQEVKLAH